MRGFLLHHGCQVLYGLSPKDAPPIDSALCRVSFKQQKLEREEMSKTQKENLSQFLIIACALPTVFEPRNDGNLCVRADNQGLSTVTERRASLYWEWMSSSTFWAYTDAFSF